MGTFRCHSRGTLGSCTREGRTPTDSWPGWRRALTFALVALEVLAVLGCRLAEGSQVRGALLRRLERSLVEHAASKVSLIIVSGGNEWRGVAEASAMSNWLLAHGVPKLAIQLESRSANTFENARFVVACLKERGLLSEKLGLVTCDWHMPRALRAFAHHGVRAEPLPAITGYQDPTQRSLMIARELLASGLDTLRGWSGLGTEC